MPEPELVAVAGSLSFFRELGRDVMRPNDLTRHSDSKPKLPVITGPGTRVEG